MQTIEYNKETKKLTLYNGVNVGNNYVIVVIEGVDDIVDNGSYYAAVGGEKTKLKVPIKKTNIIYL
jgi:hypothetical protein